MANLNEMTSKELKELAKELKVKSWWSLSKAALIEEIEKIQNASEEETAERNEQLAKEDKLFEHYSKNWTKYGPKNNWTDFLKKYNAGKIELIEDIFAESSEQANEEPVESIEEMVGQDTIEEQERDEKSFEAEKPKEKKSRGAKGKQIEFNGKSMNLNDWAKELGMTRQTLYARLYIQNWDVEKAFTTPGRKAK